MEAAFFDLDKTVIAKASVAAFGRTLYHQGLISKRLLLRTAVAHLLFLQMGADHDRLEKIRRRMLMVTKGWEKDRISAIVNEALSEVLEPIIYKEALDLISEHQNAGRRVVIVSSAPEEIVNPLADFLGADDAIASRARVKDGRYTGELDFYAYGEAKADAVRSLAVEQDFDLEKCFAYSDSHTDIPMLSCVGSPVAVNPDKELMRVARSNNWPILQFTHPMPLSEERANRRVRVATFAIGVSACVTTAAAVSYMRTSRRSKSLRRFLP